MNICIFCSANNNIDPGYFRQAGQLGELLALKGHTIVYGGCDQGLMECVSKACVTAGGRTIGVVPSLVESHIKPSNYITERIDVANLSERKQKMMDLSDIFIALPGGIGTLDEIFSVAASATIGYHSKPIILFNIHGFWNSTLAMLEDLRNKSMLRGPLSDCIQSVSTLTELDDLLSHHPQ